MEQRTLERAIWGKVEAQRTLVDAVLEDAIIERHLRQAASGARGLSRMFEAGSRKAEYYTGRAHAFEDAITLIKENKK
jgi:hypothetical protein